CQSGRVWVSCSMSGFWGPRPCCAMAVVAERERRSANVWSRFMAVMQMISIQRLAAGAALMSGGVVYHQRLVRNFYCDCAPDCVRVVVPVAFRIYSDADESVMDFIARVGQPLGPA